MIISLYFIVFVGEFFFSFYLFYELIFNLSSFRKWFIFVEKKNEMTNPLIQYIIMLKNVILNLL